MHDFKGGISWTSYPLCSAWCCSDRDHDPLKMGGVNNECSPKQLGLFVGPIVVPRVEKQSSPWRMCLGL